MKFVFLILHYMNADVTSDCIDSILNSISSHEYEFVVVDNASNNGSIEVLQSKYKQLSNIHFIVNQENLGYARGNNVGFLYAKNVLKADWICLANNDLIFTDTDWITKILTLYGDNPFYVLGPDVITPEGIHQNPMRMKVATRKEVLKKLFHDRAVYLLLKLRIQRKLRGLKKEKADTIHDENWKNSQTNFEGVLHGSCMVFSPDYIREFDGLYSGTFLYVEEEILCNILQRLGYRYVYSADLKVTHCHATSFKRSVQDEDKRKAAIVKNRIASYRKFARIVSDCNDLKKYLRV